MRSRQLVQYIIFVYNILVHPHLCGLLISLNAETW